MNKLERLWIRAGNLLPETFPTTWADAFDKAKVGLWKCIAPAAVAKEKFKNVHLSRALEEALERNEELEDRDWDDELRIHRETDMMLRRKLDEMQYRLAELQRENAILKGEDPNDG